MPKKPTIPNRPFWRGSSHEIRTPLNAILGLAAIELQNEALPAEVNDAFAKISNSGDLLLGIINDILDVSRIEAGKLELTPAEYDVASLINDTVYINIVKYEKKPIQFILNIDENIPKTLFGDEIRIKQILNNLLSNAFKYTDAGKIEFSVSAEETESDKEPGSITVVFRVRDTGQGITAEQMVRLFDEYSRFNKEANRETEGTGLGMNITMNLINLMNGAIVPESEPGRGSVFTVRLPQGKTGAPPLGKEAVGKLSHLQSISEPDTKKTHVERNLISSGKVLIVDDVEINIFIAKEMMSFYGLEIDSATSGPEAIEKIKNNSYNIVFMDHMMPVMDGIITTGEIRKLGQEYEKIPIIALTANAVSGMKEMFLANGFNGYLSKPIDMQELDSILKEWMPIR
ncbi:MAG: ATP-binding protein [Treponema sp.]|nr:ATP-binding protein [Treponema sp.]